MLRYLGIYPVAILLAIAIATFVTKHRPIAAPVAPAANVMRSAALSTTPSPAFAAPVQAIESNRMGHYVTPVQLEGHEIPMIIDTGASFVALTNEDANELGIRPAASEFTLQMQTANGVALAARAWLPRVRVGSVEVHDVQAIVMAPGASQESLLGMSFLSRLRHFGVSNGKMQLEQ
jgi:aspartyl protease family protein